ncbi:hypothetical protein J6590_104205 [Homalodisca vitripennis]|nr:hypothetical protein J6590_104205 [Homalodisca vitripennis]
MNLIIRGGFEDLPPLGLTPPPVGLVPWYRGGSTRRCVGGSEAATLSLLQRAYGEFHSAHILVYKNPIYPELLGEVSINHGILRTLSPHSPAPI